MECVRERLEDSMENNVEKISESLLNKKGITKRNNEEIMSLVERNRRHDASQLLLESIFETAPWGCRIMWNTLLHLGTMNENLLTFLTHEDERGSNTLAESTLKDLNSAGANLLYEVEDIHRCTLRNQSMKLKGAAEVAETRLLDELYIDLTVIKTSPERPFIEHDEGQGENTTQNLQVEFDQLFRSSDTDTGRTTTTVVCGAAGTGKSTMIQKIIHDWATKDKYKQFAFLFHFNFQNLNRRKCRTSLNTIILDAYPYFKNVLEDLWKESEKILFIFDDFDQFDQSINFSDDEINSKQSYQCLDPRFNCSMSDIIRCLIEGDFLKGSSVLITARPWKLETLRQITADLTFQIMGFTSQKVKEYFRRYFRDEQFAANTIQLIGQSDILRSMCCNPLFCSVLTSSLESEQTSAEVQGPGFVVNHTQLFCAYATKLFRRCGYNEKTSRESLFQLGNLALNGIACKKYLFEMEALGDLNVRLPNFTSACMIPVPTNDMYSVCYKFTHSSLQDFVAALIKVLSTSGNGLKGLLNETFPARDGRFSTFSRFLVGLSSRKSTYSVEWELGSFHSNATSCVSEWLKEFVKRRVPNLNSEINQVMFLNILHCLFEFGDTETTTETLEPLRTIKFNLCRLKTSDCVIMSGTLIYSEVMEELDLSSCRVQLEGIQQLEPVLHRCKILRLNENDLQDSGVKCLSEILKKPDCKIQLLELKSNHITDDCLESLFSALTINRSLTELNLSNFSQDEQQANKFTDSALQNRLHSGALQRKIRWIRNQDNGNQQEIARENTESRLLILISE
ncbi:NACHT, LRR and PYD domains-containing protein 1 homolog [Pristis pectinata]|uniref:NACHT, LRR and PYD domains-containing protein 1 homolog n=1 Tax=Pristis pectinata TaxID=685728 RepID=UPI00223E7D0A|nr:NACHT, LRR and PYD domains-containing protein 1 homolog [Pristis pectinata]